MGRYLDIGGTRYLLEQLHDIMEKMLVGDVDLSDYVTKTELQKILDELNIDIDLSNYVTKEELEDALADIDTSNIDLSAYATKEYVTDAINNAELGGDGSSVDLSIYAKKTDLDAKAEKEHTHTMSDITDYVAPDLSAYATREEIPSLDGYATEEYVDNAISNIDIPTGGNVDLSNYYTKEETYNKTEVDTKIASAGGSDVMILSMEDWKELNTKYDENINFQSKKIYFDTTKAFKDLVNDATYRFYLYDGDGTGMTCHNYVKYKNGILNFVHNNRTTTDDGMTSTKSFTATLYDKSKSTGDTWDSYGYPSPTGEYINGWKTTSLEETTSFINHCLYKNVLQTQNWITTPNFGYKSTSFSDTYDINGEALYLALMKCIVKIEDADGNEVAFKTVPTTEDYLEYVNTFNGADLSNYYTKSEVDALIPNVSSYTTEDEVTTMINEALGVIENGSY